MSTLVIVSLLITTKYILHFLKLKKILFISLKKFHHDQLCDELFGRS